MRCEQQQPYGQRQSIVEIGQVCWLHSLSIPGLSYLSIFIPQQRLRLLLNNTSTPNLTHTSLSCQLSC
ncbi:hypothetical protein EYF80_002434 [Liparis tanakae]|uniref:Uncharacterized protein n=1 Tax=Liparis tanakae TaxID=230148 RepID=A0A4Z2JD72_9TELE|nr:hypothetical protein EYF80_002434 [Liparis tanakae]